MVFQCVFRQEPGLGKPHLTPSDPISTFACILEGSSRFQLPARPCLVGAIDQQFVSTADPVEMSLKPLAEPQHVQMAGRGAGNGEQRVPQRWADAVGTAG
jgi:hypothetical protein